MNELYLILLLLIISTLIIFVPTNKVIGQTIILSDVNTNSPTGSWEHYIDTLESHGVQIYYISEEDWTNLLNMDVLWLFDIWQPFTTVLKSEIINFSRCAGKIVLWVVSNPYSINDNDLLLDSRWQTTLEVADTLPFRVTANPFSLFSYYPLTNMVQPYALYHPPTIYCGDNAYPFVYVDTADTQVLGAISYPFLYEDNCSSFVLLITGTHHMEIWLITEPGEYRLGSNILLVAAGVPGYELEPCAVPEPYIIQVDSCPNCGNPGDTITLTGNNLWQGSNENIGGDIEIYVGDTVVTPIDYSHYAPNCSTLTNTWLKFICPELPSGNYFVQLGHKAILFDAGEILIPCESPHAFCLAHPLPFSPNNDGINDYCKFEYPGMSENNGIVSIFNLDNTLVREFRNGDIQFSSKGTITWDGRDSEGNVVNTGVYLYLVKVGSKIVCNGTVYVVR